VLLVVVVRMLLSSMIGCRERRMTMAHCSSFLPL
jgi:hypothetical protein